MDKIYKKLQECSICAGQLTRDVACITKCGHLFHRGCINDVLNSQNKACPNCRKPIVPPDVIDIIYDVEDVLENKNVQDEIDQRKQELEMKKQEVERQKEREAYEKQLKIKDDEINRRLKIEEEKRLQLEEEKRQYLMKETTGQPATIKARVHQLQEQHDAQQAGQNAGLTEQLFGRELWPEDAPKIPKLFVTMPQLY